MALKLSASKSVTSSCPKLGPVNGCQGEIDNQRVSSRGALEQIVASVLIAKSLKVVGEGGLEFAAEGPFVRVVVREALRIHRFVMQTVPALFHQRFSLARRIEFNQPVGQAFAVVGAGHKVPEFFAVKPKRTICAMARGQNGPAVLHAHPVHLRLASGGHLEFVAEGGRKHAVGRHLARGSQAPSPSVSTPWANAPL